MSVSSFKPGCKSFTQDSSNRRRHVFFSGDPKQKTLNQLTWHHCWHPGRKTCLHFLGFLCLKIRKLVSFSHKKSLPWDSLKQTAMSCFFKLKDQTYSAPELPDANESAKESYRYVSMSLAAQILSESISHKCLALFRLTCDVNSSFLTKTSLPYFVEVDSLRFFENEHD